MHLVVLRPLQPLSLTLTSAHTARDACSPLPLPLPLALPLPLPPCLAPAPLPCPLPCPYPLAPALPCPLALPCRCICAHSAQPLPLPCPALRLPGALAPLVGQQQRLPGPQLHHLVHAAARRHQQPVGGRELLRGVVLGGAGGGGAAGGGRGRQQRGRRTEGPPQGRGQRWRGGLGGMTGGWAAGQGPTLRAELGPPQRGRSPCPYNVRPAALHCPPPCTGQQHRTPCYHCVLATAATVCPGFNDCHLCMHYYRRYCSANAPTPPLATTQTHTHTQ